MLLKYMFHPRVNPVCVKVVGNLHQIIEFGMAKKLGWSYLHEIACLSTPYYTLLGKKVIVCTAKSHGSQWEAITREYILHNWS